jgi:hypothetical protein
VRGIYPFGAKSNEVMLYGTVAYQAKDGSNSEKDWAARAELVKHSADGHWQLQYYQVYLVSMSTCDHRDTNRFKDTAPAVRK